MGWDRRPKWSLAVISRQRATALVIRIVVWHLPWGKRGSIVVLYLHEVGLTCREGLRGFIETAQHLGVPSNVLLHQED